MEFPGGLVLKVHVESHGSWFGVWRGGEYINIYANEADAKIDALSGNAQGCVHCINTTGDDFGHDLEEYMRNEVESWAEEWGDDYCAQGPEREENLD
ncbi:hypothetical protein [Streptomyces sp. UNOC14_S4]|uniref:hypothetical protein n=1 Tax=Streptomyces sp. UNOC14_S4 TaxID=2872340 RepID=UPI001E35989E|nr:hypothetical protein [Streptomyces sp. UNOC14_S4]MCC3766475.1 hypothetical protein [Streptomyces sp. UNOC14_S4]